MEIDVIFKIAAVGIIVTIVCQILKKSDREDIATIVSLAGLIIVLTVVLDMVLRAKDPGLNPALLLSAIQAECPELAPDYVSYHRKQVLDACFRPYE